MFPFIPLLLRGRRCPSASLVVFSTMKTDMDVGPSQLHNGQCNSLFCDFGRISLGPLWKACNGKNISSRLSRRNCNLSQRLITLEDRANGAWVGREEVWATCCPKYHFSPTKKSGHHGRYKMHAICIRGHGGQRECSFIRSMLRARRISKTVTDSM